MNSKKTMERPKGLFFNPQSSQEPSLALWCLAVFSVAALAVVFYNLYLKAPANFPEKTIISVRTGATLKEVTETLKQKNIVRSPLIFQILVGFSSGDRSVNAGDYFFKDKVNVFSAANRFGKGNFGLTPVKVLIPEGTSAKQMAVIIKNQLSNFDDGNFLKLAEDKEGYLFPDTYLFAPNATPAQVISVLEDNFNKKIKTAGDGISLFGRPLKDVVKMASILEEEGRTTETRRTIAGILWKRLAMGMPLQVDAPFQYIIGKNTFQLTNDDLKINSPYNTYIHKGFPPTPITNPGLDSIVAAVTPIKTAYFYYLATVKGEMHYARTFEEHVANKEKYLR